MSTSTGSRTLLRQASKLSRTKTSPCATTSLQSHAKHLHNSAPRLNLVVSNSSKRPQNSRSALSISSSNSLRVPRRTLFIQTENTPNNDALKFKPNSRVLPEGISAPYIEYLNPRSTLAPPHPSPLAAQLMQIDGVTSVFYGSDFITVGKDSATQWGHVKPEIFSLITEAVTAGQPLVNIVEGQAGEGQEGAEKDTLQYDENDSEVVSMIKELLETRIRPAIQEDGGDIDFRGFKEGWVLLKLRGACRTCDSSTVTLRNGIESMLMHYIEEVKGVQQVLDQEEEVAMAEFARFEEQLKKKKGPDAIASTGGKGTLDAAEG